MDNESFINSRGIFLVSKWVSIRSVMEHGELYWTERYREDQTQWDAGKITTPLKEYFDQLPRKDIKILVPGCGNAHEATYLHDRGFTNVHLVDISDVPLAAFAELNPGFPKEHIFHADFFDLEGVYDLIVEQTFFCALHPSRRPAYALKMQQLSGKKGRLVGVLFEDELFKDHPPYGGHREEYRKYFEPYFQFKVFERCFNSIKPRLGRELFINLSPKKYSNN